ncbi:MAG: hypothetical protein WBA62_01255, partial [Xanthobacteraceae bacterium]
MQYFILHRNIKAPNGLSPCDETLEPDTGPQGRQPIGTLVTGTWKSYLDGLTRWNRVDPPQLNAKIGSNTTKKINLALQGGGAHGAFTWGVLDELLADERLE